MSANKRKASGSQAAMQSATDGQGSSEQAGEVRGSASTAKRAKVDTELADEDIAGDLDLQEQERKRLQQGRKGRVMTAGYDSDDDSDESNEGEGEQEADGAEDEDEDMFNIDDDAGGEGKAKVKAGKGGKKKFLELGDIEGQEFAAEGSNEEERDADLELETDEDEEGDEEQKDALHAPDDVVQPLRKRKKKPKRGDMDDMGFEMDSFHMKNEMASGRFDEEGNYIANAKDPHAEHDKWLAGNYSRKGIRSAKEAKERREKEARAKEKGQENAELDEDECMMKLAELMDKGESVLEALQRLGVAVKKAQKSQAGKHAEQQPGVREDLDQLTSLSSTLMSKFGRLNVYEETYENLLRVVRRSGLVRETWDPAASRTASNGGTENGASQTEQEHDMRQFVYKWSPAYLAATSASPEPDVQIFGPYPASDLEAWHSSGYFGDAGERVLLQEAGVQGWKRWEHVFP